MLFLSFEGRIGAGVGGGAFCFHLQIDRAEVRG